MGRRVNTAVWLEKYKRWQIKVQKDGERRTFTSSTPGRIGQRECNAKADAWVDNNIVSGNVKVGKLFPEWIEELKLTTSTTHWRNYDGYWRIWIKPVLGRMRIADLDEYHMQKIIDNAHAKKRSKKHLKNIRACMAAFVKYCRKRKLTNLIVENVTIPRNAPVGERVILQPADVVKLFASDKTTHYKKEIVEPYVNAFRFEVVTGLRPGECLHLQWSDIKNNQIVQITGSFNVDNEETKGKNENALRTFALTPIAANVINQQRALILATGIRSSYVFPDKDGEPIKEKNYYKHWVKYRDYNGLPKASPYELRHTFVSIIKTLPEGLLKPLVGHSVDMDTYSTYSHRVTGDQELTAAMVQEQFIKILKPDENKEGVGS